METIKNIFPQKIEYKDFLSVGWIKDEAYDIASSYRPNDTRTHQRKFSDALNGLALQYAGTNLVATDYGTEFFDLDLKDKSFDLLWLNNGTWLKYDFKGMFDASARTFTQTLWEHENADHDTIYACYDCRSGVGLYRGICSYSAFIPSIHNENYYIYPNKLTF